MRAYRIVKKRHVLSAFSGEGAKAYGGRRNRPGIPMVYAAESRALAALEALAHFQGAGRHIELVMFEIERLSTAQIAAELGLPVGTVYSRLSAAREQFQRAVDRLRKGEGT